MSATPPARAEIRKESRPSCPLRARLALPGPTVSSSTARIAAESMNTLWSLITRVGTRRSGLNLAILSASPNVDQGLCWNASP